MELITTSNKNVQVRSIHSELATRLRDEAAKNKVFESVCYVLSMRERTRQQITLQSIQLFMSKEGFKYSTEEYANVLKFLAIAGIGQLEVDKKGRVKALKNINITLQSIGLVAISKQEDLQKFNPSQRFTSLVTKTEKEPVKAKDNAKKPYPAEVTLKIEGIPTTFKIRAGITLEELATMISKEGSCAI